MRIHSVDMNESETERLQQVCGKIRKRRRVKHSNSRKSQKKRTNMKEHTIKSMKKIPSPEKQNPSKMI